MKIDKKKLFAAIKSGETKDFFLTYSPDSFDYTPKDMRIFLGNFEFRLFEIAEEFELVSFTTEKEIQPAIDEFKKLREKLEQLGVIIEEKEIK